MKQGSGNSRRGDMHVNPNNKSVNPAKADQLGRALGNKAQDDPRKLPGAGVPLYRAESGRAPLPANRVHRGGSQGRH